MFVTVDVLLCLATDVVTAATLSLAAALKDHSFLSLHTVRSQLLVRRWAVQRSSSRVITPHLVQVTDLSFGVD